MITSYRRRFLAAVIATVFLLWGIPAAAQCDPTTSNDCYGGGDDVGPEVGISPDGGSHTIPMNTAKAVKVKIAFSDPDGLRQETLQLKLWTGTPAHATTLTGFTWTPNPLGTFSLAEGTLQLRSAGANVLTAEIQDRTGKTGSAQATFQVTVENPNLAPVVSMAPHHDGYRLTSHGAATLGYSMPSYTSMDVSRSVGLYYNSQHANPTGFVQLDVDTGTIPDGSAAAAVTLQIFEQGISHLESGAAVTSEDAWAKEPQGIQRVGAQWSMRDKPTGAYRYWAHVRTYRADKTLIATTRVNFRVLIVNEIHSRYGAGWSPAVQRIYPTTDGKTEGLVLNEGNGVVRFFEKQSCTGVECYYLTPAGDFSRIVYKTQPAPRWERIYTDGTVVTFSASGIMTGVSDRFGRRSTYDWVSVADAPRPPAWLLIRVIDPTGKQTYTEYFDGYLSAIVDPAGRRADISYQNGKVRRIAGPTTLDVQYDTSGRITTYTDWNGTWDVAYDAHGTVSQLTSPFVTAAGQSVRLTTTYRSLHAATVLGSWVTHICCNWAAPVPHDKVYTSSADPLGHTTRAAIDRYGNVIKIIDPLGRTAVNVFNADGLPESVGNGVQHIESTWNAHGQLISQSVNGSVVYYASYLGDQLEYEVRGGEETWYSYGARGELLKSWTGKREDVSRTATIYEYDANYFLIAMTGPSGERTEWSYVNAWQNVSEVRHVREDGIRLTQGFTYDQAGRQKVVTNTLGQTTTFTYDILNRPVEIADILQKTVRYTYTGPNLTAVTDQAGKTYGFVYNALGWLETEKFPEDATTRSYAYNKDGQLLSVTDRRGQTVAMTYDFAHRMTTRTADGIAARFDYPDENTTIMTNNETQETIRSHPWVGGVDLVRGTLGGPESTRYYEIGTVYDDLPGWVRKGIDVRQYQSGNLLRTESIRYTHDPRPVDTTLAHALSIQDLSGRTTTLGYDTSGRHVRTTFPNGVTQYNWFFKDGRPSGRTFSNSTLNRELGANYGYDHLGRMTERTSISGDTLWAYDYDYRGQLVEYRNQQRGTPPGCDPTQSNDCDPIWLPGTYETYSYDDAGNRTDRQATLMANSNRYRTFDGFTLEYDAEGNLTRKYKSGYEQRLTWNALGQLASVTTNGVAVAYGYSPTGRRIRRTQGTQTRYFIYHNDDLLMELDGSGNALNAYTHMPGVDLPLSVKTNGDASSAYYYTMERPGHVSALISLSGAISDRFKYAPFGRMESSVAKTSQSLKFMGREFDAPTGLYYVRARWYDPSLARFISSDPIGLEGGINTYAYVGNDPMNALDPSGLQQQDPDAGRLEPLVVCTKLWSWGWDDCSSNYIFDLWASQRATDQLRPGEFLNDSTMSKNRQELEQARRMSGQCELARSMGYPEGAMPPPCRLYFAHVEARRARAAAIAEARRAVRRAERAECRENARMSRLEAHGRNLAWETITTVAGLAITFTPVGRTAKILWVAGGVVLGSVTEVEGDRIFARCGPGLW